MSEYNGQCCAHLRVRYLTREQDKATFGWWACEDCQHQFVPLAMAEYQAREIAELQQENAALSDVVSTLNSAQVTDYATIDALRARAEAAEKAIKDYNDSCIGACEYRVKTNHCEAYLGRGRNCPDCPRDDVIDYPAAIAAGGDDAKD